MDHGHCLAHVLAGCSEPCIGKIGAGDYRERVLRVCEWLKQPRGKMVGVLREGMRTATWARQFERAAEFRDAAGSLETEPDPARCAGLKVGNSLARHQEDALGTTMGVARRPFSIEAFGISHHGGKHNVASMVRFVGGQPVGAESRIFRLSVDKADDVRCMFEAISLRYRTEEVADLVVVDGGEGGAGQPHRKRQGIMTVNGT